MALRFLPMTSKHLADVDHIQHDAYIDQFVEDLPVYAAKLHRCPEGCWICLSDEIAVAYMFSHPSRLDSPPLLNKALSNLEGKDDCYFIHDVAVLRTHRRLGIAAGLVERALRVATKHGHKIVTLVSVQGSRGYWERLGFQLATGPTEALAHVEHSYGAESRYMIKQIG
jgi:GNAT superfamily N-acetyltransferase